MGIDSLGNNCTFHFHFIFLIGLNNLGPVRSYTCPVRLPFSDVFPDFSDERVSTVSLLYQRNDGQNYENKIKIEDKLN